MRKQIFAAAAALVFLLGGSMHAFAAGYTLEQLNPAQPGGLLYDHTDSSAGGRSSDSQGAFVTPPAMPEMRVGEIRPLGKLGDKELRIMLVSRNEETQADVRSPSPVKATKDSL